ncbi:hypothetical protein GCK72_004683 [Caenorhabditis remanei]|uniref:Uncharacterized protein n=1 Tax=Caenorhabditis remanei TaxID=31234 RepID=A0A6A5HEC1_CAERE|nr:hypothetical protein GCK72_004683 [Caenorhabditis remanei]KAF1764733.1 hypothetical protein GCK72_004683 [Caenorhabditis remanei]
MDLYIWIHRYTDGRQEDWKIPNTRLAPNPRRTLRFYWMVDGEKEIGLLEHAHDQAIWSMKWHPLGHILATGSNDNNTKFWARNRPGDTVEDIFGLSSHTTMIGHLDKEREPRMAPLKSNQETQEVYRSDTFIPGMGLDENLYEQLNKDGNLMTTDTTLLVPDDMSRQNLAPMIGAKRTLIKQPPAKKAQRQFERMWNNSKGIGAGTDDFAAMIGGMGREDAESSSGGGGGMMRSTMPNVTLTIQPSTSSMTSSQPRMMNSHHRFQRNCEDLQSLYAARSQGNVEGSEEIDTMSVATQTDPEGPEAETQQDLRLEGAQQTQQDLRLEGGQLAQEDLRLEGGQLTQQDLRLEGGQLAQEDLRLEGGQLTQQDLRLEGGQQTQQGSRNELILATCSAFIGAVAGIFLYSIIKVKFTK